MGLTGGFVAEGKEINVMTYSLIFKTLSGRETCHFCLHFIGQSKSPLGEGSPPLMGNNQVYHTKVPKASSALGHTGDQPHSFL